MNTYFGTCATAINISEKAVTVSDTIVGEEYVLNVYFQNGNNAGVIPTLTVTDNVGKRTDKTTICTTRGTPAAGTELTSWPDGSIVTFVRYTGVFYITNWRPITNINNALSNYVSKSGMAADFYTNVIVNSSSAPSTTPIHDDILSFLALNTETHGIYHKDFKTLIPYVHREARVGYNGAYTNDNNNQTWYQVASAIVDSEPNSTSHLDYEIVFFVKDTMARDRTGMLTVHIHYVPRGVDVQEYTPNTISTQELTWDYKSPAWLCSDFQLISDGHNNVQLWTRCPDSWRSRIFSVIDERSRTSSYDNTLWTLYNNFSSSTGQTEPGDFNVLNITTVSSTLNTISLNGIQNDEGSSLTIGASNLSTESGGTDERLLVKGARAHIYFWADNTNTTTDYVNGGGMWIRVPGNPAGRRVIDYQVFNPSDITQGGKILLGNSTDTLEINPNSCIFNSTSCSFNNISNINFINPTTLLVQSANSPSILFKHPTANIMTANNNISGNYYPGLRFTDGTNTSKYYAQVLGSLYTSGTASLILDTSLFNQDNTALAPSHIYLQSIKSTASSLIDLSATKINFQISNTSNTITNSVTLSVDSAESHLFFNGQQGGVYFWADDSGSNPNYQRGAGVWYRKITDGVIESGGAKRIIDYQINSDNNNGIIYIGSSGDVVQITGKTLIFNNDHTVTWQ